MKYKNNKIHNTFFSLRKRQLRTADMIVGTVIYNKKSNGLDYYNLMPK